MAICSNGSAPLNKMVSMPMYAKTLEKLFSRKLWGSILVYSIRDSKATKFVEMMDDLWPFYGIVKF